MKFKAFIAMTLFYGVSISIKAQKSTTEKPNFIFILTDDQRYDLLGCTGNTIVKTPNIDQLAKDGVMFTNGHITSAICTPSRVSILLSQFERKHGINFNSGTSMAPEAWEQSYPMVMRKNGYYTGYIGKNHSPVGEGGYESKTMDQSFDYWYAGHKHLRFYPKRKHEIFKGAKNDTQVEILDEGVADFLSNEYSLKGAKHFLGSRPNNQPFCLSLCLNVPHGSSTSTMEQLDTDPEIYRTLYRDQEIPMVRNYVPWDSIKTPKIPYSIHFADERQEGYNRVSKPKTMKELAIRSMQTVTGIDKLVGNLRQTLKKNGLDKNTIIVFTSDHGLFWGEFGLGGKALCYEVTTRVPFIVYNPKAPKKARGKISNELVQSIDVAPTMLDYAGIEIPRTFQGKSIKSLIEGKKTPVHDYLYTENLWSTQFGNPRCESVQDKEWKYIRYYENKNLRASAKIKAAKALGINLIDMLYAEHDPSIALYRTFVEGPLNGEPAVFEELFHLKTDPDETTNLASAEKHQSVLEKMRKVWDTKIHEARGTEAPKILRYTKESRLEKKLVIHD